MITPNDLYLAMCSEFESKTGCTVYPDSDVGLRFSAVAAALGKTLLDTKAAIDNASVENLSGELLERAAADYGLTRLPSQKAVGQVRFYTQNPQISSDIPIPIGTLIASSLNPDIIFATKTEALITPDNTSVTVDVYALKGAKTTVPAGALTLICSPVSPILKATNPVAIEGGCEQEDDGSLSRRLKEAMTLFPLIINEGYISAVAKKHSDIADANARFNDSYYILSVLPKNPESFDIDNFNEYISENIPLGCYISLTECVSRPLDLTVTVYNPVSDDYEQTVTDCLKEQLDKCEIGKPIDICGIYNALKKLDFCENFSISGINVTPLNTNEEIYRLGNVSFERV